MLKVMLVDDEEIIRSGIASGIDWSGLGFQVVGEAEDGEEAIQKIEELKPDIVITDIKMPFMDGLQFIEAVKPIKPDLYIIIISGHDEFQYAQKALKLGAYDYILKPIELGYLRELLLKIKNENELKQEKEHEVSDLRNKVTENINDLRQKFIQDVINGQLKHEEIESKYRYFNIDVSFDCFTAMILQMDDYYIVTQDMQPEVTGKLEAGFRNSVYSALSDDKELFILENKAYEYIVCIPCRVNESVKKKIEGIISRLRSRLMHTEEYTATCAVGKTYRTIGELEASYKEAQEALNYKFIIGNGQDIRYENLKSSGRNEFYSIDYNDLELESLIKFADKKLIDEKLKDLSSYIRSKGGGSYLYMQIVIGSIYMQALRILKDVGSSAEEVFTNPVDVYNKILGHQTVEGMVAELSKVLYKISDYVSAKQSGRFNNLVEKARDYVRKNYFRDDLSLDEIANYCDISSCYFSVIFKQEAGETFIDYLTSVRLEKAKELLRLPEFKAYEVSYKVGYNNPTYFSTLFKKYTGLSPTEYRNSLLKNT